VPRISKHWRFILSYHGLWPLIPLLTGSRPGRGSEARVERRTSSPPENAKSDVNGIREPQAPDDPQLKTVLDRKKTAAASLGHLCGRRAKGLSLLPKALGTPEHVFHIDDRQIPGPAGTVTVRIYTPNPTRGLPILVFFHGGGFVAGNLDTHDILCVQ